MYKKTINCQSCEVKCDIIIRQTNFDSEVLDVEFCPICSTNILDDEILINDDGEIEW